MSIKSITSRQIEEACLRLQRDEIVAIPTETVYGLGALATSDAAVQKIFKTKGRPAINPLICHMADLEMAEIYAEFSSLALKLAKRFWPGALTLVLPKKGGEIAPSVTSGLSTIAVRVPAHEVMHEIIRRTNTPIAAPSANRSGRMSPTEADHVRRDIDDPSLLILDGGQTNYGLESTVLAIENDRVILLRQGALPLEEIESFLGHHVEFDQISEKPRSPGQLLRHYAPLTKLILNSLEGEIRLGYGTGGTRDLSPKKDVQEAAHNLFSMLEELDQIARNQNIMEIHIAPIPRQGIGAAINDRLERAAASYIEKGQDKQGLTGDE